MVYLSSESMIKIKVLKPEMPKFISALPQNPFSKSITNHFNFLLKSKLNSPSNQKQPIPLFHPLTPSPYPFPPIKPKFPHPIIINLMLTYCNCIRRLFCCKDYDAYLDSSDPVQTISNSQQIETATLACIDILLDDKEEEKEIPTKYTTTSKEEAEKWRRGIQESKITNPKVCTEMMKDLLKGLPNKKKKLLRRKSSKQGKKTKEGPLKKKKSINEVNNFNKSLSPDKGKRNKAEGEISIQSIKIQEGNQLNLGKKPSLREQYEDSREQEQFEQNYNKILEQKQNFYLKIVKAFVYLYTSPYIYKDLNKALSESRYENYIKVIGFVTDAINKLPIYSKSEFKPVYNIPFTLYRGIKSKSKFKESHGYWKAFTSCSLSKQTAEQFAGEKGTMIEILLKPPIGHTYIKVPDDPRYAFHKELEIILFPFFHYQVLERISNKVKVRQVKQTQQAFG